MPTCDQKMGGSGDNLGKRIESLLLSQAHVQSSHHVEETSI